MFLKKAYPFSMETLRRFCTVLVVLASLVSRVTVAEDVLTPASQSSSEGYYTLRWEHSSSNFQRLEVSSDATFQTISVEYPVSGMKGISLTGYQDGTYFFRLIDDQQQASNSATVVVKHRSLSLAIILFALGFSLFVVLIGVLIFSSRRRGH
ncbi:hypothetical protein [Pleionea litopenaei]|uniref:Uncharacterized protein n=1 Tax=Pleionea litopenaei TaxID=3070815 RepID=A0AA51RSN5_9GAMM|nr:hypothetical protein [Pleionea sp. HL-JVS1]WMS86881.1 hypothetical protein Q9312_16825 [Pleionea sp. HL-JVS1]